MKLLKGVYNTITHKYEDIAVTEAVYNCYLFCTKKDIGVTNPVGMRLEGVFTVKSKSFFFVYM